MRTKLINLAWGKGRRARDEARVAPHQFDQTDPVAHRARFGVRHFDRLNRCSARGLVAEALTGEQDVVIDGLRNSHHRNQMMTAPRFGGNLGRAAQGAIAADDK